MSDRSERRRPSRSSGSSVGRNVIMVVAIVGILVCIGSAYIAYYSMQEILRTNTQHVNIMKETIEKKIEEFKVAIDLFEERVNKKIDGIENELDENNTTTKNTLERMRNTMTENRKELVRITRETQNDLKKLARDNHSKTSKQISDLQTELRALMQRLIDLYS